MTARPGRSVLALVAVLCATAATSGCGGDGERPVAPAPEPTRGPSASACSALRGSDVRASLRRLGVAQPARLQVTHDVSDEQTDCRFFAKGVAVFLTLDRADQAQKRYWYRVEEQQEFHAADAARRPRLVRGVGQDDTYGGAGAFWTPSLNRLISYRDQTMLLLGFTVDGVGDARARRAATRLASGAWHRLFGDRPPSKTDGVRARTRYPHP